MEKSALDKLEIIARRVDALRPKNHVSIILLTNAPLGNRLLRVIYKDQWYGIVNKVHFQTEIKPQLNTRQIQCNHDDLIIPPDIPIIENDDLIDKIFNVPLSPYHDLWKKINGTRPNPPPPDR